jgi:tetratricopeptide (TPR) repeat protein
MRARTIWLAGGGIVAAFVAILVIPQTRFALLDAIFNDDVIRACDSQDPKIAMPACSEVLNSGRYENIRGAALVRRAQLYSDAGQHDLAIMDLEESVRLFPAHIDARMDLAREYAGIGNHDGAIAQYDDVIKRDPKNTFAYMFRAGEKEKKGDAAGAAADKAIVEQLPPLVPVRVPQ